MIAAKLVATSDIESLSANRATRAAVSTITMMMAKRSDREGVSLLFAPTLPFDTQTTQPSAALANNDRDRRAGCRPP
jgi:hypothetical protein